MQTLSNVIQLHQRIRDNAIIRPSDDSSDSPSIILSAQGKPQKWLIDIRSLAMNTDDLDLLATVFWESMRKYFPFQVGGLEVGAVPLLAAILMKGRSYDLSVNSFVVRKSRKKRGLCQQIEGEIFDLPIVVVDDLVNSSGSIQRVWIVLKDQQKTIDHVFTYVSFDNPLANEFFEKENIKATSVFYLQDFDLSLSKPQRCFPTEQTLTIDWQFSPKTRPNYTLSIPHSTPVVDGQRAYFGSDEGYLYAVNKVTGKLCWRFKTGESLKGILSSPAWVDNSVLFGAYDGNLYRLNCDNGSVIWQSALAEYIGSSPCVISTLNRVFIGLEHNIHQKRGEVVAVDLKTGEKVWGLTVSDYIHSTPIYDAESHCVFVGCNNGKLYAVDAETGIKHWEFLTNGPIKVAPTLDCKRRQVIAPSFDGYCYGIDMISGQENFRLKAGSGFYSSALVHGDHLYNGSCDKYFYIYDLNKNKELKKLPVMGRIVSSPQWIQSSIWFGANDGFIRQISPDGDYLGGILLSERPLTPIIYDATMDRYFVVTMGNHLLCLLAYK